MRKHDHIGGAVCQRLDLVWHIHPWLPYLFDLFCIDFFLWQTIKDIVACEMDLVARIAIAIANTRRTPGSRYLCKCSTIHTASDVRQCEELDMSNNSC